MIYHNCKYLSNNVYKRILYKYVYYYVCIESCIEGERIMFISRGESDEASVESFAGDSSFVLERGGDSKLRASPDDHSYASNKSKLLY